MKKFLSFLGWPLLVFPLFVLLLGAAMNQAVVHANGGQMPVSMYACEERMNQQQQESDDDAIETLFHKPTAQAKKDYIHKCADSTTKMRWMDDWVVSDNGISSLGDLLQDEASSLTYICYPIWLVGEVYFIGRRKRACWILNQFEY